MCPSSGTIHPRPHLILLESRSMPEPSADWDWSVHTAHTHSVSPRGTRLLTGIGAFTQHTHTYGFSQRDTASDWDWSVHTAHTHSVSPRGTRLQTGIGAFTQHTHTYGFSQRDTAGTGLYNTSFENEREHTPGEAKRAMI